MIEKSGEDPQCLMNKAKMTTMSAIKLEAFLHSQNMSASWMICHPRLLRNTLKNTELIKNVRGGIGCQYFDRKESRLSAPEEKRDVIRCLKTLISISLDVTSKPHI